jgi:GH15 family glucan-1,4-alpha-glucosidase
MYKYGMIGNCQISALISTNGNIGWCCFPKPDSEPLFSEILDIKGGKFQIAYPNDTIEGNQYYLENTNVLITELNDENSSFTITDFSPRFYQNGQTYRPSMIIRKVTPIKGNPIVKTTVTPILGWSKEKAFPSEISNYINYSGYPEEVRLTSSLPPNYINNNNLFELNKTIYFVFTWGAPIEGDLENICELFLSNTIQYWRKWVQHTSIPTLFQKEVIRSALLLKLNCFEDTGAILASISTSLPEEINGNRNWDYRYCWLRDAYFTIMAFYKLGHFEEIIGIIEFILNIFEKDKEKNCILSPVYKIDGTLPLPEIELHNWEGYQKTPPIRSGNQAAEHIQNDAYGEMLNILLLLYCDEKFSHIRNKRHLEIIEKLAINCCRFASVRDAGIWEIRNNWTVHSFTSLISLNALKKLEILSRKNFFQFKEINLSDMIGKVDNVLRSCLQDQILYGDIDKNYIDASCLMISKFNLLEVEIQKKTLYKVFQELSYHKSCSEKFSFIFRYKKRDDFGTPKTPFLICSFWLVEALTKNKKFNLAHKALKNTLVAANHVGLFAEHYCPETKTQLGNFPQCYSHVGLINAAFAVSPQWDELI